MELLQRYLRSLYERTMREAYAHAYRQVTEALGARGRLLDCGCGSGWYYAELKKLAGLSADRYAGIDWNGAQLERAQAAGLSVRAGDLNQGLPYASDSFDCVMGLSVLEHLLNGCFWLRECHRALRPGGTLVVLTPNISTFFTMALLLAGKMPSSGPHPDSAALVRSQEPFTVAAHAAGVLPDIEGDTPVHRHLVVFSFRVLRKYLDLLGFAEVAGRGFGLYPFPNVLQGWLEAIDPYHCHQMVFVARKAVYNP